MVGRPSKGALARVLVASTRISADEEERLVLRYGTVSTGLRVALDNLLGPSTRIEKHRHVRGDLIRTEWVQGVKVHTYMCACGTEITG